MKRYFNLDPKEARQIAVLDCAYLIDLPNLGVEIKPGALPADFQSWKPTGQMWKRGGATYSVFSRDGN